MMWAAVAGDKIRARLGGASVDMASTVSALTPVSVAATGAISTTSTLTSSGATSGVGYATGAGGAVTQATSKATGVTLNKVCGAITLNNAALAATTIVTFTLTNSAIAADDDVRIWVKGGLATPGSYRVAAEGSSAGSRTIIVENKTAGSLSEAVVLGFSVVKVVVA